MNPPAYQSGMAFRKPSLLSNSLTAVSEDGTVTTTTSNNASSAMTSNAAPGQREGARMNMLRRMRAPPFQYAWTMYHDKHSDSSSYEGRLTVLLENIITVKPFWEAYNRFPLEQLKMKDSVHFFKRGVKPVWEDPRNVKGGAWTFRIAKEKSAETWKEVLMMAVGEQFADVIQPKDDLCGVSLSVRFNSNLITVWNRDGSNQKSIDGILNTVLDKLSPDLRPKEGSYYYKRHSDHAGFNEVVSRAVTEKEHGGKIEEAQVNDEDIEKTLKEEEAETQQAAQQQQMGS
ncbi:hypothetical protein MMC25_003393 [Agyrium rufum]|nr:hypothetical protein [Agyrium rufum]